MSIPTASPVAESFPDLIVASVQMAPRIGDVAGNVARSVELIESAAARGATIVVLPELTNSGYVFASREEAFSLAEAIPRGDTPQCWIELAQRLRIHIVAGMAERVGDRLYNAALIAGPHGHVGTYRKLHLWADEHLFFEPGDLGLPVFHTGVGRVAAVICYDGWFPEVYRTLAVKGADLVCMPTNWVPMRGQETQRMAMANTLAMAGAHSNALNIVCADRIGEERGRSFLGQSVIVGSDGWLLAGPASADREEILLARINLKQSRAARHLNDFNHVLNDRRADVYGAWPGVPAAV